MSSLEIALGLLSLALAGALAWALWRLHLSRLDLERAKQLAGTQEGLALKFQSIATEALRGNAEQFLQLAKTTLEKETVVARTDLAQTKTEIDHMVEPLKKILGEYQNELRSNEKIRERIFTQVESELRRLSDVGLALNRETSALKNALKRPHVRGRWGELQLKNCIELAGMSEYCDVTFQDQQATSDGNRLIPDMTVRMPGGRVVIVDAKTPIDAFLESLEAPDEETRAVHLARHGRHVKEHVKKLSAKSYADNLKDSADFTVMFLPNESFLYAALEVEPDLIEYSLQKKILISTPPTLIGLLKVINFGWNEQRLAQNAEKISAVGEELHKRLVEFVESYVAVGKQLERAKTEYDKGLNKLESRVIVQARRLEQLGAKSAKDLPAEAELSLTGAIDSQDPN